MSSSNGALFEPYPAPPRRDKLGTLRKRYGRIESYLFLATILGYPMVALVSTLISSEDNLLAIAMRSVICLAVLGVLWVSLTGISPQHLRFITPVSRLLVLFYSIRLIADWISGRFPDLALDATQYYAFSVIPLLGVSLWANFRDPMRDTRLFFIAGGLLCVAFFVLTLLGLDTVTEKPAVEGGRLTLERFNPISLGQLGVTSLIAAAALYFERAHPFWLKIFIVPVCFAAGSCLILSASRGPIVCLAVALITLLTLQKRWKLLAVVVAASFYLAQLVTSSESEIANRILAVGSDRSSLERIEIQGLALQQFLEHPVLGSGHLEIITNRFPHNIFLDSAMALGIVGLTTLLFFSVRVGFVAARQINRGELLLPLLAIQFLVAAQFSGAFFNSLELWICGGLLLIEPVRPVILDTRLATMQPRNPQI